jgi:hypothetical protein
VNQTVQKKLGAWMKENNPTHWAIGCKITQWQYNTQVHQHLKDTPYLLTYGQHPRVGISNLPPLPSVLDNLSTETDLHAVYSTLKGEIMEDGTAKEFSFAIIARISYAETIAVVSEMLLPVYNHHQTKTKIQTSNCKATSA